MKKFFQDILKIEDVMGVMFFSFDGTLLYRHFVSDILPASEHVNLWETVIDAFSHIREADVVYERLRIYIRKTKIGYLIVFMDIYAPIAMVRLNCDIILPQLKHPKDNRGLMRFFKR